MAVKITWFYQKATQILFKKSALHANAAKKWSASLQNKALQRVDHI